MKTLVLSISSIIFSSCMHVGIPMMQSEPGSLQSDQEPVLKKEVIAGNVKATGVFPALQAGHDAILSLKICDAMTEAPVSNADVNLHSRYVPQDSGSAHAMMGRREYDVDFDDIVRESGEAGTYSIAYRPSTEGLHTLMFHITAIDGHKLEPQIVVEATRMVSSRGETRAHGMMGGNNAMMYMAIGAGVMGAMMLAMMFGRSWIR